MVRRWLGIGWLALFCVPACAQVMLMIDENTEPVVAGDGSGNLIYTLDVQGASGYGDLGDMSVLAQSGVSAIVDIIDIGGEPASIEVTLVMPEGVSLDGAVVTDGTFTGFDTAGVGTWDVEAPMFDVETMTVTITVASNAADGDVVSLEAQNSGGNNTVLALATATDGLQVSRDIGDIGLGGMDYDFEDTTILREVDLQLAFSESQDPFPSGTGEQLDIGVSLLNAGPSDASNLEIALAFTASGGGSLVMQSANAGNLSVDLGAGTGTWSFASLPAGSGGDFTLVYEHGKLGLNGAVGTSAAVTAADETLINTEDDDFEESTSLEGFKDTDRDGLADAFELMNGLDPLVKDSDGDGTEDGVELAFGFGPLDDTEPADPTDTDGDLIPDAVEIANQLDPNDPDSNGDGRRDGYDTAFAGAPVVTGSAPFGDVNRDGNFNFLDVRLIYGTARSGQIPATTTESFLDIDRDGTITVADMMRAMYVLRGIGSIDLVPTQ